MALCKKTNKYDSISTSKSRCKDFECSDFANISKKIFDLAHHMETLQISGIWDVKKTMPVADVRGPIIEIPRNLHVRGIRDMTENNASYSCTRQHRSVVLFIGYFAMSPYEVQSQMIGGYCAHLSKEVGACISEVCQT